MRRRARVLTVWIVVVGAIAVAGFAAGRATLAPPRVSADRAPGATYVVEEATVGRSSAFRVGVSWPVRPIAFATAQGTVTSVEAEAGEVVSGGAVLFRVDERPVVVAAGPVPAFRDLREGDMGADVAQLQAFLHDAGFLAGSADGRFGGRTTKAVEAWQKTLGLVPSGEVRLGDLVFAPQLPARVVLGDDVVVGVRLEEGDPTVRTVLGDPQLSISVEGSSEVPAAGARVVVSHLDHRWPAVVGPVLPTDESERALTTLALAAPDGGPVCGSDCSSLPLEPAAGSTVADVDIVPSASGPVVPVAALGQGPGGDYFVSSSSGAAIPVTVLVTDGSRAVVDGVLPGEEILLVPGDDTRTSERVGAS